MDKKEKEQAKILGQIVCNFVNAETSAEACSAFWDDVELAFVLSPGFVERAKKALPFISNLVESETESIFLKRLQRERNLGRALLLEVHQKLEGTLDMDLWKYRKGGSLSIHWLRKSSDGKYIHELVPITDERIRSLSDIQSLEKLWQQISAVERLLPEQRVLELEKLSEDYGGIVKVNARFDNLKQDLRTVLEKIVQAEVLREIQPLWHFLSIYNRSPRSYVEFGDEDLLVKESSFSEEEFEKEYLKGNLAHRRFYKLIEISLTSYLIGFLIVDGARNLVQKCKKCEGFFVRSKNNKRFIYCQDCSRKDTRSREKKKEQQRKWRQKKKALKQQQRDEARIANYMKNLDCTREEAEVIIEADREIEKSV
jgi:uncharacterized Zn finger protein (UPF0148 family)